MISIQKKKNHLLVYWFLLILLINFLVSKKCLFEVSRNILKTKLWKVFILHEQFRPNNMQNQQILRLNIKTSNSLNVCFQNLSWISMVSCSWQPMIHCTEHTFYQVTDQFASKYCRMLLDRWHIFVYFCKLLNLFFFQNEFWNI